MAGKSLKIGTFAKQVLKQVRYQTTLHSDICEPLMVI